MCLSEKIEAGITTSKIEPEIEFMDIDESHDFAYTVVEQQISHKIYEILKKFGLEYEDIWCDEDTYPNADKVSRRIVKPCNRAVCIVR